LNNFPCLNCGHKRSDHKMDLVLINNENYCEVCNKHDMWDRVIGRFKSFHKYVPDNLKYLEKLSEGS